MAKFTTYQRKHMITKSNNSFRASVMTISLKDGKQDFRTYEIAGNFTSDIETLSAISARYTVAGEIAVAPVANGAIEKITRRDGIMDFDLMKYGFEIKDGDKFTASQRSNMLTRTLTVLTVKTTVADFASQEFNTETVTLIGNYENKDGSLNMAEIVSDCNNAFSYDKKPSPYHDDYTVTVEKKLYGISLQDFGKYSFPITDEE